MRLTISCTALLLVVAAAPHSALAQQAAANTTAAKTAAAPSLGAYLKTDVEQVQQKIISLARAIPAEKYAWRPAAGVRSTGEVFKHVVSDNYLLPAVLGHPADPSTGITTDFNSAVAYEHREMSRDSVIAALERSFAHLEKAMATTPPAKLDESVSLFGQSFTVQQTWILTAEHLHEHLGQLIAYARSNGVTPPWSK
jgi:uncharacterized damage-inducible protein DinB